jgi:hypothetical protein
LAAKTEAKRLHFSPLFNGKIDREIVPTLAGGMA